MENDKPIAECGMRGFEFDALLYEVPYITAGLVLAGAMAAANLMIVDRLELLERPIAPFLSIFILVAAGFGLVLWAASYYPQRVSVYPDRLVFDMLYKSRETPLADVESFTLLTEAEAKGTFLKLGCLNLSPAVTGSVMLKRDKGLAWVFSPEDPETIVEKVEELLAARGGDE